MATRTLTDTATISWDEATANQQKGNVIDDSITNAKLANVPTATIKGRATAGTGDPQDLTAAQVGAILGVPIGTGFQDFTEIAEPAAPASNVARLRAIDDGAGTTTFGMKDSAGAISSMSHYNRGVTGSITRRAFDKLQDVISVMDFIPEANHTGIREGSAVVDVTTFVQAAIDYVESINYASASNGRPAIRWPAGRYFCGALTVDKHMGFIGDGRHSTIIRLIDGVTGSLFTLNAEDVGGTSTDDTNHYYFKGLTLSGNRVDSTTTGTSRGIYCPDAPFAIGTQYGPSVLLDDVEILGFTGDGIHLGVNRNWALMNHVIVRYCNDNGLASFGFDYRISNSDFGVCKNFGIRFLAGGNHCVSGIAAYGNTMAMVANSNVNSPVWVFGSDFVGNLQHGISVASATAPFSLFACKFNSNSTTTTNTYSDILITDTEGCKAIGCDFIYDGVRQVKNLVETVNVDNFFFDENHISSGTAPFGTAMFSDFTKIAWAGDERNGFFLRPETNGPSFYSGSTRLMQFRSTETRSSVNMRILSTNPRLSLQDTDAAADEGKWIEFFDQGVYQLLTQNDAESVVNVIMQVDRTGAVVDSVKFGAPFGYLAGQGGAVTQLTSKATTVVLNLPTGQITMNGAILNANTTATFTLTNSSIAATDQIICEHISGGTLFSYSVLAVAGAGSATIHFRNITAGNLTETPVLKFTVIKAVNA